MKKIYIITILIFLSLNCDITPTYKNTFLFNGNVIDATYEYYIPNIYVDFNVYDVRDKLIYSSGVYTDRYGYFEFYGKHNKEIEELYKLDLYFLSDYYVTQRNTSYHDQWEKNDTNVSYRKIIRLKRR